MRAGDMQASVLLKRKVATRDSRGGEVVTFVPLSRRSAAKAEPIRGREFEALQRAEADIAIRFTIYYRDDVRADWRIEWRGQDYDIVGLPIDIGARKQWLELMCRTSQNG